MHFVSPAGLLFRILMSETEHSVIELLPPLSGQALIAELTKSREPRKALAEGFVYEKTINMICAEPGAGKSTLTTQIALEMASGFPVFGHFRCVKPFKVLYAQNERDMLETFERLEVMKKVVPIKAENLYITDELQKLNLLKDADIKRLLDWAKNNIPNPDIIFLDPIYTLVSGGLKEDVPACAFIHAMNALHKQTGAVMWYGHHTSRQTYDTAGQKVNKDDPFYGSQWLKAHVTSYYHVKSAETGTHLLKKKDNYDLQPKELYLEFNSETQLSHVPYDNLPALERVKKYLDSKGIDGQTFYFKDVVESCKISTRAAREVFCTAEIRGRVSIVSSNRNRHLYRVAHAQNELCSAV